MSRRLALIQKQRHYELEIEFYDLHFDNSFFRMNLRDTLNLGVSSSLSKPTNVRTNVKKKKTNA